MIEDAVNDILLPDSEPNVICLQGEYTAHFERVGFEDGQGVVASVTIKLMDTIPVGTHVFTAPGTAVSYLTELRGGEIN